MKINVLSFTQRGYDLSLRLKENLSHDFLIKSKWSGLSGKDSYLNDSIYEYAGKSFKENMPLIFIGATGIAVRAIAPSLKDKLSDIPVIVIDEGGSFVIPLLSGHVGGANELAREIGEILSAFPVITTATDVNNAFSVDEFAKKNYLNIENKDGIARVSKKVLEGRGISILAYNENIFPDVEITKNEDKAGKSLLYLSPREYVLGIGCKRDTPLEVVESLVNKSLNKAGLTLEDIACIASIDIKKNEEALISFSGKNRLDFFTYPAKELTKVPGEFQESDFVKKKTGVGNVCERAAVLASGFGELVLKKQAESGVTLAIAKRKWRLSFE